jgi:hypothetical protein
MERGHLARASSPRTGKMPALHEAQPTNRDVMQR